jgi:flagellar assembly protein FliH
MASVIKAGKILPSGTVVQHAEFNLEDISANASQYLDGVRKQVAQIVHQAQQQSQQIAAQAAERGRQTALEAARKTALEELHAKWQTLAPALQQAVDATAQLRSGWFRHWEQQVIHVAVAIAERLVRGELSRRPEISQQWIRESLELASSSHALTLRLNPADYETLGSLRETLCSEFSNLAPTSIVADPQITPGGCRVDTQFGHIDQQLDTQLARIEEELTG